METDTQDFVRRFDAAIVAGNLALAAQELEIHCDLLLAQGHAELFATSVAAIPPRLQAFHPRMMLALSWRLIAQWRFGQVADLLAACRMRIDEIQRHRGEDDEVRQLRHALQHREMMLCLAQDDMSQAEKLCRSLLNERYRSGAYVKGSLYTSLLQARREQFKLRDLDLLDTQAIDYLSEETNSNAFFVHNAVAGLSLFAVGRNQEAVDRLRETLSSAATMERGSDMIGAISALPLAEILYERGEIAEAQALVTRYLPHAREMGIVDQLISGYRTAARLCVRRGRHDEAITFLDEGELFAAKRGFRRLSAWILAERLAILLKLGTLGFERHHGHALRRAGVSRQLPGSNVTTLAEAQAMAWISVAEAQCRLDDGLRVALAWSRRAHREGAVRSRIRWQLIAIRFLLLRGEALRATRLLLEAMEAAAPGGFVSDFMEEQTILALLKTLQEDQRHAFPPEVDRFVSRILAQGEHSAAPIVAPEESPASLDRLSPREIDILGLAAGAWRNQDIAMQLGLTEGTVKWYMQQIYDKLGVRKRSLAVDRARRFGIIRTS
jgi:LuxR family maltose regulon positive regulatory protein